MNPNQPLGDAPQFVTGNIAGANPNPPQFSPGNATSEELADPINAEPVATPSLANAWNDSGNQQNLINTGPIIVAQVLITPKVTGKIRLTVTGTINNTGGQTSLIASVTHGLASSPADYTQGTQSVAGGSLSTGQSLIVDFDKLPTPIIFPVGQQAILNFVLQAGNGNVVIVPAHGIQIEAQERAA